VLQTDGGYLGSDFEAFFSAVVSGAAGVYVGVLLQDAGIETDLVVRPGQRVSLSGDASLPRPPRWGGGGFTVQQRGSLSLRSVAVPEVAVSGGDLSLSLAQVPVDVLAQFLTTARPGSAVRLSEVTVPDSWQDLGTLTGSATVGADGVAASGDQVRCSITTGLWPLGLPRVGCGSSSLIDHACDCLA